MRLVQFVDHDSRKKVALVSEDGASLIPLVDTVSTYELVQDAIRLEKSVAYLINQRTDSSGNLSYEEIYSENRLLQPLDHPDPAHLLVSGTGLDHLGSALARDSMHSTGEKMSDSMKMFKLGLQGGKPKPGEVGSQPEWFYKGDGNSIVPPGSPLELPSFALNGGEEAEVVTLYVISQSGEIYRVGFALGNEYSDHILEKENYLYLAHSKLRDCSIGPELLLGPLPDKIKGQVKLLRKDKAIWEDTFLTGESNMTNSISNLEYHHFKYERFRRPGDVHCHFLGASVISFAAGVIAEPGDVFEISSPQFGKPLRNSLRLVNMKTPAIHRI